MRPTRLPSGERRSQQGAFPRWQGSSVPLASYRGAAATALADDFRDCACRTARGGLQQGPIPLCRHPLRRRRQPRQQRGSPPGDCPLRARDALRDASWLAQKAGVHASTDLRAGAPPSDLLLSAREGHDLLVLGCHGGSRAGGIIPASTATQIAHRTEGALLVARRTVDDGDFPRSLLLATDGSSGSWAATRTATRVAQACLSELRVVHVPDGTHPERYREVLRQIAMIEKLTGVIPLVIDTPGHPAERISEAARVGQSSLIVIGRRGLRGVKALGSVSER